VREVAEFQSESFDSCFRKRLCLPHIKSGRMVQSAQNALIEAQMRRIASLPLLAFRDMTSVLLN
jgi:hypothetical protein